MNWKDHLIAALGYHELGMHRDGLDELAKIPESQCERHEVTGMQLSMLQAMAEWERGAALARDGVEKFPEAGDLYLAGAYCIRRSEGLESALAFLKRGADCLADEPCYWFNLGCYHCQLGALDEARDCVERAIGLDENYQRLANDDEDLKPLREAGWPEG